MSAVAYATPSAGTHPTHTLPMKLHAIRDAGFTEVELSFTNLEAYAAQEFNGQYIRLDKEGRGDLDKLREIAKKVKVICDELGLVILAMHP